MGDGHVGVFLLVIVAAVGSVKGNLCPFAGDWLYHNTTGTCMSINTTKLDYLKARKVCQQNLGGSNRTIPGELVFIFDKNTDDFVKVLLEKTANVDTALIGLNNRVITSEYRWGETPPKQVLGSYTGWASGSPTYTGNHSVGISADGWKVMNIGHKAAFVCQVKAVMALPTISCPPAEVREQTSIVCSVNVPTEEALTELRFNRSEQEVASCSSGSCRSPTGYTASVRADPTSWTSTLQISNVQRSDEGNWSCSVKFGNGQEVTSNQSDLKVYSVPSGVECKAGYLKETLNVSCTTKRMYPEGVCKWDSRSGPSSQLVTHESRRIAVGSSGTIFYRTVCNASVIKPAVGKYEFNVSVYPSVPGLDGTNPSTVKIGNLTVNLGAPTNPPVWLDSKGETLSLHLDVVVNQTVTITCQITDEGQAAVYSLTTKCFSQPLSETSGNVASVNITTTQDFHGQNCSCYGTPTPVANSTYVTYVTFRVKSSPRIISFGLQSNPDMRDIEEKKRVFMTCNATGYPQYQLSLVRDLDGKSLLNRTSSEANSSEVTYNMTATCPTGRRFTCQAKNDDGQKDTKQLHLRVRCAPKYCLSTEKVPKHGIALGSNKTLTMRVNAYPAPTSFRLYKDNGADKVEIKSGYKVNFSYIDEEADVGEITVELYSVQQPELGMYALYTNITQSGYTPIESYLPFELLAQGRPNCPETLTVSSTFSDSIILSWTPGFDGGFQQRFTILRYDPGSATEPQVVSEILQSERNVKVKMSYTVTGLTESTTYTFGLRAQNQEGVTNCTLHVIGSTDASSSPGDWKQKVIVVAVVLGLLLVIILVVIVVLVLVRRRRSKVFTAQVGTKDDNVSNGGPNELNQDNTYALVNKQNKKKGKKNKSIQGEKSSGAAMYSNVSNYVEMKPCQGVAADDSVYANAAPSSDTGKEKLAPVRDDGRTVTEDGLIYAQVMINVNTTNSEAKGQVRSMGAPKPVEPGVEYVSIDFAATAKLK